MTNKKVELRTVLVIAVSLILFGFMWDATINYGSNSEDSNKKISQNESKELSFSQKYNKAKNAIMKILSQNEIYIVDMEDLKNQPDGVSLRIIIAEQLAYKYNGRYVSVSSKSIKILMEYLGKYAHEIEFGYYYTPIYDKNESKKWKRTFKTFYDTQFGRIEYIY